MKTIGIIGGGFTGTMTAVQLIDKASTPIEIILVDKQEHMHKGIAYNPYSGKHLLNVKAGEMSAFPDHPSHFLEWVMRQDEYQAQEKNAIASSFLPRALYGRYLESVWNDAVTVAAKKRIVISKINAYATALNTSNHTIDIILDNGRQLYVHDCIIATGNHLPANPRVQATSVLQGDKYYRNPWTIDAVTNADARLPVLIMGNGLTMADTVLALVEQGYTGDILTISPNGFNLLPHAENITPGNASPSMEANTPMSLYDWVSQINQYKRVLLQSGGSIQSLVDILRPQVQSIWQSLSIFDRQKFVKRVRHIWNAVRHRIPASVFQTLHQLIEHNRLQLLTGRIAEIEESNQGLQVVYIDSAQNAKQVVQVSRIINCTGPETDITKMENHFLQSGLADDQLKQDPLKLGIATDVETFRVLKADDTPHRNLFTLGVNLRGMLWESTAVYELRTQAAALAAYLCTHQLFVIHPQETEVIQPLISGTFSKP